MRVQLPFSFHFYLLYLLLNSCDGNNAFWRSSMLAKQSSSFSRKHRTLSLQICVCQTFRMTTVRRCQQVATQSPAVPDWLCYVSLGHRQQTATTLCQSSPTSCAALPTQLTWSSVLCCRWTNDSLSVDLRDPTCSDESFRRSLKTFLFAKY